MHAALAPGCSPPLFSLSIALFFLSQLKKYSLISNGDFTERHWSSPPSLHADKEEVREKEKNLLAGLARIPPSTVDHKALILLLNDRPLL